MPDEISVDVDVTDPFAEPPGPVEPFPKVRTRPPALLDELAFLEQGADATSSKASIPALDADTASPPGELAGLWNDLALDDEGSAGSSAIEGDAFAPPPVASLDVDTLLQAGQVPPPGPPPAGLSAASERLPKPPPAPAPMDDEEISFEVDLGAAPARPADSGIAFEVDLDASARAGDAAAIAFDVDLGAPQASADDEIEFTMDDLADEPPASSPEPGTVPAAVSAAGALEVDLAEAEGVSLELAVEEPAAPPLPPAPDVELDFSEVAASAGEPGLGAIPAALEIPEEFLAPPPAPAEVPIPPSAEPPSALDAPAVATDADHRPAPLPMAAAVTPVPGMPPAMASSTAPTALSLKALAELSPEDTAFELATLARDAEGRGRPDIAVKLWRAASLLDPMLVPAMRALKRLVG